MVVALALTAAACTFHGPDRIGQYELLTLPQPLENLPPGWSWTPAKVATRPDTEPEVRISKGVNSLDKDTFSGMTAALEAKFKETLEAEAGIAAQEVRSVTFTDLEHHKIADLASITSVGDVIVECVTCNAIMIRTTINDQALLATKVKQIGLRVAMGSGGGSILTLSHSGESRTPLVVMVRMANIAWDESLVHEFELTNLTTKGFRSVDGGFKYMIQVLGAFSMSDGTLPVRIANKDIPALQQNPEQTSLSLKGDPWINPNRNLAGDAGAIIRDQIKVTAWDERSATATCQTSRARMIITEIDSGMR